MPTVAASILFSTFDRMNLDLSRRLSIAPMLDCTDRHERYFLRLLSRNILLYSEMVVSHALLHCENTEQFLGHEPFEYPAVLQLGGSNPADLAQETFLRFVRAQGYRERGKPIAYLMRIARSVCVDASRERRLETVSLDFDVPAEEGGGLYGKEHPHSGGSGQGQPEGAQVQYAQEQKVREKADDDAGQGCGGCYFLPVLQGQER